MKSKIIIISWLISLMFMATDNIVQALIALCCFGVSSLLIRKYKKEVTDEVQKLNNQIEKRIQKQSI